VPLSSVPIVFVTWLEERGGAHYAGTGVELADLSWLVLLGALAYLGGSALVGLRDTLSVPEEESPNGDGPAAAGAAGRGN